MTLLQFREAGASPDDFLQPPGEPALVEPDSISWMVFSNPVSLVVGGIAAVILELAEPKVRTGVWDHTSFRTDPLKRMRRTGAAAMITVYAARSRAIRMIGGVRRMHEKVRGTTPGGDPYHANDPELLRWVHATAAFGFLEAYHRHVKPVQSAERDIYFAEGAPVAQLYGADEPPESETDWEHLLENFLTRLEPSPILSEFLSIMETVPLLPGPLHAANRLFIHAAIDLLPPSVKERLGFSETPGFPGWKSILRFAAVRTGGLPVANSPLSLARIRVGKINPATDRDG